MITTLTGSNDFLIDTELKNLVSQFRDKHGENAIEQIDVSEVELQSIMESVSNLSFLSPTRLIVLKRGSANKQFIDSIDKIIENTPDTNELVIVEPNIDKRLSYFKTLKKLTDFKAYDELDFGQLAHWIDETVKNKGGHIKNSDARYLIEIAGNNQLKLANEIDKLISYKSEITRQDIDDLVEPIPQTTIFQLLDAAFSGKNKELLRIYDDQKRQKGEPQQVIAMLTWQVHILAMINAAGDKSVAEIASITKVSPYVIGKSMEITKKMNSSQIRILSENLLELDIKLKNQSVDVDDALLHLLLSINS